jgi:Domain of unknown function (DUF4407)
MSKANLFQKICWSCSGATVSILEDHGAKHAEYTVMGSAILFTGFLASLSGGYSFYVCFDDPYLSIFFGILWGIIILNLDRSFVINIKKKNNTGREYIKAFLIALPRIIMAVAISLTFSTPIEMRLFQTEIFTENTKIKYESQIKTTETIINALDTKIGKDKPEIEAYKNLFEAERSNPLDPGAGDKAGRYKDLENEAIEILKSNKNEKKCEENYKKLLEEKRDLAVNQQDAYYPIVKPNCFQKLKKPNVSDAKFESTMEKTKLKYRVGFLDQYIAFNSLKKEDAVKQTSYLITLLMICLEILPIFLKIMAPIGSYDKAINKEELEKAMKRKSDLRKYKQLMETERVNNIDKEETNRDIHKKVMFLIRDRFHEVITGTKKEFNGGSNSGLNESQINLVKELITLSESYIKDIFDSIYQNRNRSSETYNSSHNTSTSENTQNSQNNNENKVSSEKLKSKKPFRIGTLLLSVATILSTILGNPLLTAFSQLGNVIKNLKEIGSLPDYIKDLFSKEHHK